MMRRLRKGFSSVAAARDWTPWSRTRGPIGTVKRNGPGLASWLKAHPGWHVVAESANRRAAWAAAWKIRHGERRGFEDGLWDAQAQNRDGRWVVIARRASKRRSIPGEGMDPLF